MATKKADSQITSTIEALSKGADSVKPKDGATLIKDWITLVNKDDDAKVVADDLQELHDQLGEKQPDGKKIAQLVKKLGDETAKVAKKADEAHQDSLKELADSLHSFAKELK